jgi:hypothetical protein
MPWCTFRFIHSFNVQRVRECRCLDIVLSNLPPFDEPFCEFTYDYSELCCALDGRTEGHAHTNNSTGECMLTLNVGPNLSGLGRIAGKHADIAAPSSTPFRDRTTSLSAPLHKYSTSSASTCESVSDVTSQISPPGCVLPTNIAHLKDSLAISKVQIKCWCLSLRSAL